MAALHPGQLIGGRYRLEEELARGGMGAVHRATDVRLSRSVAIKVLLSELASDTTEIARFEREASAVARLSHPGIVQVLDVGHEGDVAYLVMELVRGRTVAALLRDDGRFAPARAADVAEQALFAIAHAHAAGIVHRDLKPGNLMLVPTGGREIVKVLDFGIAQLKTGTAYTRLTQTGAVIGTPAYMPPEQARGEALDARADVYAMGVVLWCMLTGKRPFDGRDVADTITRVLTEVPARADRVVPGVPAMLASLCDVAMQKDPSARFPSAFAFGEALVALRQGSTLPASTSAEGVTRESATLATVRARPGPVVPASTPMLAPAPLPPPAPSGWSRGRIALAIAGVVTLGALVACAALALVVRQYADAFGPVPGVVAPGPSVAAPTADPLTACERAERCCRTIAAAPESCSGIQAYATQGQVGLDACQSMAETYATSARAMGRTCD